MFELRSIKDIFIITALFFCSLFFLVGLVYFSIEIDESTIEKTRYCPNCGIDLVERR